MSEKLETIKAIPTNLDWVKIYEKDPIQCLAKIQEIHAGIQDEQITLPPNIMLNHQIMAEISRRLKPEKIKVDEEKKIDLQKYGTHGT